MQRRVGLARAMVLDPEVILFDEPTTGLDPSNVRNINELILRLNQEQGTTAVVVTHDIASAEAVSHRWALFREGRVESVGSPDELKRSTNPYVRRFIEGRLLEERGRIIKIMSTGYKKEVRAGIFLLGTLGALVAVVLMIGARSGLFTEQVQLFARFEDVSGLVGGPRHAPGHKDRYGHGYFDRPAKQGQGFNRSDGRE